MLDWRDIGIRAGKTALQSFLAVLIPALTTDIFDTWRGVLVAALIAAIAAGLSVVQNALVTPDLIDG